MSFEFAPIASEDLRSMDLPPTTWGSFGLIPFPGLVAISGAPGSFKTFFCLQVAIRLTQGLPTFSEMDIPVGKREGEAPSRGVLFIEEENTINMMKEREIYLSPGGPVPGLFYYIQEGFKLNDNDMLQGLIRFCEAKNIGTVFMDPFISVSGVKDENNNAEVAKVMDLIRLELVKRNITVVFIHHPSKGENGVDGLRGAGDILGKVDVHVTLEAEDKEDTENKRIIVKFAKMRIADRSKFQHFVMELGEHEFLYRGSLKEQKSLTADRLRGSILIALMEGPLTQSEVADKIGGNRTSEAFREAFKIMLGENVIERIGSGPGTKYHLKKTT